MPSLVGQVTIVFVHKPSSCAFSGMSDYNRVCE